MISVKIPDLPFWEYLAVFALIWAQKEANTDFIALCYMGQKSSISKGLLLDWALI